jgi:hypothetical protein
MGKQKPRGKKNTHNQQEQAKQTSKANKNEKDEQNRASLLSFWAGKEIAYYSVILRPRERDRL